MPRNFYTVTVGKQTGVFDDWLKVREITDGVPGARFKGYKTEPEAWQAYQRARSVNEVFKVTVRLPRQTQPSASTTSARSPNGQTSHRMPPHTYAVPSLPDEHSTRQSQNDTPSPRSPGRAVARARTEESIRVTVPHAPPVRAATWVSGQTPRRLKPSDVLSSPETGVTYEIGSQRSETTENRRASASSTTSASNRRPQVQGSPSPLPAGGRNAEVNSRSPVQCNGPGPAQTDTRHLARAHTEPDIQNSSVRPPPARPATWYGGSGRSPRRLRPSDPLSSPTTDVTYEIMSEQDRSSGSEVHASTLGAESRRGATSSTSLSTPSFQGGRGIGSNATQSRTAITDPGSPRVYSGHGQTRSRAPASLPLSSPLTDVTYEIMSAHDRHAGDGYSEAPASTLDAESRRGATSSTSLSAPSFQGGRGIGSNATQSRSSVTDPGSPRIVPGHGQARSRAPVNLGRSTRGYASLASCDASPSGTIVDQGPSQVAEGQDASMSMSPLEVEGLLHPSGPLSHCDEGYSDGDDRDSLNLQRYFRPLSVTSPLATCREADASLTHRRSQSETSSPQIVSSPTSTVQHSTGGDTTWASVIDTASRLAPSSQVSRSTRTIGTQASSPQLSWSLGEASQHTRERNSVSPGTITDATLAIPSHGVTVTEEEDGVVSVYIPAGANVRIITQSQTGTPISQYSPAPPSRPMRSPSSRLAVRAMQSPSSTRREIGTGCQNGSALSARSSRTAAFNQPRSSVILLPSDCDPRSPRAVPAIAQPSNMLGLTRASPRPPALASP